MQINNNSNNDKKQQDIPSEIEQGIETKKRP